jgi:hypothetical protein
VSVGVPVPVGDHGRVILQFQTLFHSHLLSPCQGRAPPSSASYQFISILKDN